MKVYITLKTGQVIEQDEIILITKFDGWLWLTRKIGNPAFSIELDKVLKFWMIEENGVN